MLTDEQAGEVNLGAGVDLSVSAATSSPTITEINTLVTSLRTTSAMNGKITATLDGTVSDAQAKTLTTDKTKNDAITVKLSDAVIADAANLSVAADKTTVAIDAGLATGIAGGASDIASALTAAGTTLTGVSRWMRPFTWV